MNELREFTKSDWYGFAGATADANHPAMIGEVVEDGYAAIIVADMIGIEVIVSLDEDYINTINYILECDYETAVKLARHIVESVGISHNHNELIYNYGFVRV